MKIRLFASLIILFFFTSLSFLFLQYDPSENILVETKTCEYSVEVNSSRMPAESCVKSESSKLQQNVKLLLASTSQDPYHFLPNDPNERRIEVDVSDPKQSFLDSVALVSGSTADWLNGSYGSGALISECHLITSHHVVFNHGDITKDDKGNVTKEIKEEEMRVNKEILVGFGQIDGAPWKIEKMIGRVVGFDKTIREAPYMYNPGKDFAIIKLPKDSSGKFPGQKRPHLCLNDIDNPLKINDMKSLTFRNVGHPYNKYLEKKKLTLWQDITCKIVDQEADHWASTCQIRPGMSGGPIIFSTEKNGVKCNMLIGINHGRNIDSLSGLPQINETDIDKMNIITPISEENRLLIQKIMKENPCN